MRKFLCRVFNHAGLVSFLFLLGVATWMAVHGDYLGFLLHVPFLITWWLYSRMEKVANEYIKLAKESHREATKAQEIAKKYKERYEMLINAIGIKNK